MRAPIRHQQLLDELLPKIADDERITGIALSGSLVTGQPDDYSDIDLILVVADEAFDAVMAERLALIGSWTSLVAGFTGEHVGEPRLIITLVGPPLLHVDFKFVRASDFGIRTENPELLLDRDGSLARTLDNAPPIAAALDLPWIEDRFWIWIHYGATKVARGELFETIGFLSFLRDTVLGPLATARAGEAPRGVRRLERIAPEASRELEATLCGPDRREAAAAIAACARLYRQWSAEVAPDLVRSHTAERLALTYLAEVATGLTDGQERRHATR